MRRRSHATKQEEQEMVAYLAAVRGRSQADITKDLGLKTADVSRYMKAAREAGLILVRPARMTFTIRSKQRLAALQQRIQERLYPTRLCTDLNRIAIRPIRNIRVFRSDPGANSDDVECWDQAAREFGGAAAGYVRELILGADTVFCAFGRQLLSTVYGIRRLGYFPPWTKRPIRFVPVWGEVLADAKGERLTPSFAEPERLSASFIAAELSRIVNGSSEHAYSLLAAPAIIPEGFTPDEVICIKRFIHQNKAYSDIFGDLGVSDSNCATTAKPTAKVGLLRQEPDALLAGAGVPEHSGRFWSSSVMDAIKTDQNEMRQLVVGDIGGVLIDRPGLKNRGKERLEEITARWMGLQKSHMARIAENARTHDRPGTIVVGVGRLRATVIYEAIKTHGLINELIIDTALADELTRLVNRELRSYATAPPPKRSD